ncbi:MAG: hypothetical protein QM621_15005 [Aeromicrobium sp.]|uniref:hypothetical protein n=1 Tax=Aeromicrobium sp. TaxID=1871063 RepID=UPI0039E58473
MGYATEADYIAFTGATTSVSVALLDAASRDVDELLIGAVYDTDHEGLPTRTSIVKALREAACAQAQWLDAIGDDDGAGAAQAVKSASLGSASYTIDGASQPGAGAATGSGRLIGGGAVSILRVAGLLPVEPYTYG